MPLDQENLKERAVTMSLPISAEDMEVYRRTARERALAEARAVEIRRERAWQLARQAAAKLKAEFGVSRVRVFGSLLEPERFSLWSDVDLAAWGLTTQNWLKAIGAVRDLGEVPINLVDVGCCAESLLAVIEREGVEL